MKGSGLIAFIAKSELLRLTRDRKALFFAVVLPILLYPLLFWGSERLGQVSEERMEAQTTSFVADLRGFPPELAASLRDEVGALETVEWSEEELDELRSAHAGQAATPPGDEVEPASGQGNDLDGPSALQEAFDTLDADLAIFALEAEGDDPRPGLIRGRLGSWIETESARFRDARLEDLFGEDPALPYVAVSADVASDTDAAGLAIGKFLPMIAIFVLIGGGAFAALEAFAAEREVGTLETLLVQPVDRMQLAYGKFASVVVTSAVAWVANTASFLACGSFGMLGEVDLGAVSTTSLFGRVAVGALVFSPTVLFVSAILSVLSSRARSFREGQNYLLPATLVGALLTAPSLVGDVEFDALLALIPVTGPSLAMRDALAGSLNTLPAVLATAASAFWAWVALRGIASTLDAERLLQGADVTAEAAVRRVVGRRATAWGLVGVAGIYVVGGWIQSRSLWWGLAATLWIVALGLALIAARDLASRTEVRRVDLLGLKPGRLTALIGALLLGPAFACLAPHLMRLQERVLPMPDVSSAAFDSLAQAFASQSTWVVVFLFAVSPGICEELLFRGAVLGGLLRDTPAKRAVVIQAALFALAHGSVHRLLPTFLLGLLFGGLRVRTGSVWPGVLTHIAYNASLVLGAGDDGQMAFRDSSSTFVLCAFGVVGALLVHRASAPPAPPR
ncbi:MAG: CPBP family glutamic-type intramembrane protease [Planctomycetota bacterium]